MSPVKIFLTYLAAVNIVSFVTFYRDKRRAARDKWRIKERTLHTLSFAGGVAGSIAAMLIFHHKTKKLGFCLITVLAAVTDAALIYLIFKYGLMVM